MIQSMTGYATAKKDIGAGSIHLELRAVNSRFLDLGFRIVEEWRSVEPVLREQLTAKLGRGKVDCRLQWVAAAGRSGSAVDPAVLAQLIALQSQVRAELPTAPALTVGEILRWPGILGDLSLPVDQMATTAAELIAETIQELIACRAREGARLAGEIRARVGAMRQLIAEIAPTLPAWLQDFETRLADRLRAAVADLDTERMRQEVGLFAARIDVAEELARLDTHLHEVERVLDAGGHVGKRLDFLMQELNREANTLASKSMSSALTRTAVDLKLLIEQMREQIQNLE
ncbi:MAG TPA: YicC family protein [Rhodocyclaceae bacterium]|nr:YicC family protein [Rhodocyclaceae bacterium]